MSYYFAGQVMHVMVRQSGVPPYKKAIGSMPGGYGGMAESAGAKQQEKTRSRVRPVRVRVVQKQLVSVRHGATVNELIEDQIKNGGNLQQRAAVRFVSGDVASPAPAFTESRFAHDFSRVPARTVAPQRGLVVQARFVVDEPLGINVPGGRAAEASTRMPEPGIQLQPT
jgi:hypothetical protein